MKKIIIGISIFVITAVIVVAYPMYQRSASATVVAVDPPVTQPRVATPPPLIQMAILLDTSSSMDGLINQTREQLWQVVNQFAKSKKDGMTPKLEVAVYEYGNDTLSSASGYVRKVTDLTTELDAVSEALFSLTTNGGSEYCGYVIREAVSGLAWSTADIAVKVVFIAGNEPFTQGPVPFQQAIAQAKQKGITVNTIHAGDLQEGATTGWRDGAVLAGGDYMNIDHNHVVAHIDAPQDKQLADLNQQLNHTYIPYGNEGKAKAERQALMDSKNSEVSAGLLAKRVISKASTLYRNDHWDLVDATQQGTVDLEKLEQEKLPEEMRQMDNAGKKAFVSGKVQERKRIQDEITRLSKERDAFVKEKQRASAENNVSTIDNAMTSAIIKQGKSKGYTFDGK
jgi:hypothetical protein